MCRFFFIRAALSLSIMIFSPSLSWSEVYFPIISTRVITQTVTITETVYLSSTLPDTGINFFANSTDNYAPYPLEGNDCYGQDAHYNPKSRQHFYVDNGDGTVTDNVTELMWMQNDDDAQRDWNAAVTYCGGLAPPITWSAGYDDWRLPDYYELSFLTDRSRYGSGMSINQIFEGNAQNYWTSSPDAAHSGNAWLVHFNYGNSSCGSNDDAHYVRCVRGKVSPPSFYVDNNDGTVTDENTGLMWMRGTGDVNEDGSLTSADQVAWSSALAFCESLSYAGHGDWRLPDVNELQSLVKIDGYSPAIDPIFSCRSDDWYKSSSPYAGYSDYTWRVHFNYGVMSIYKKDEKDYVRCVRSGP